VIDSEKKWLHYSNTSKGKTRRKEWPNDQKGTLGGKYYTLPNNQRFHAGRTSTAPNTKRKTIKAVSLSQTNTKQYLQNTD